MVTKVKIKDVANREHQIEASLIIVGAKDISKMKFNFQN